MVKKINLEDLFVYGVLILVVIAGICLRFYHINHLSYWYDELYAITTSSKHFFDFLDSMKVETNPPLYQFILYLWVNVFGNSPMSGRFLSGVLSIISLPIIFFLCNRVTIKNNSLAIVVFFTFSSGSVYYAQEVRSYTLLILLSAIVFFYWLMVLRDVKNLRNKTIFFIFSLLCIYTHYFGFIFVNLVWLYLIIYMFLFKREYLKKFFLLFVLLNLFFIPEIYKILFIIPQLNTINWIPKPTWDIYIHFFSYIYYFISFKKIPLLILFLISLVIPLFLKKGQKYSLGLTEENLSNNFYPSIFIIVSLLCSTFIISQFKPMVTSRNLLVLLTPIYYLIVHWYSSSKFFNGKRVVFVTFCLSSLAIISFSKYYYKDFIKEPWRDVVKYASEKAGKNGIIFTYELPEYIDYYLVDVYQSLPSKKLNRSESDLINLLEYAKKKDIKDIVFIETSWDQRDEVKFKTQKNNIGYLTKKAKSIEIQKFVGFQTYHFIL